MMGNEEPNTIASSTHERSLYDVFISFNKRCDTRNSFTGNLFNALRSKRFKIFMDNEGLNSGDQIIVSTLKALEGSKIAIVVLSEKYADSTFCLDELINILDCKIRINQLVLPIFYDVDPSDVRYQTGRYGEAMASLEGRFGKDYEGLPKWKSALSQISNISGLNFKTRCQEKFEYELIQEIVERVSNTLPRNDVFLSFSEKDTHYTFSGYLYNALNREGFKIFMNHKKFNEVMDHSSQSFVTIIEKSRLSIIFLSENYAYSSSCLDELVTILDVIAKNNINQLLVWPIFYKVIPSDVRYQKNSYEKAMNEHENKYGKDSQKVNRWRSALFEVSNLKGWSFKHGYEYEYELVETIVDAAIKI